MVRARSVSRHRPARPTRTRPTRPSTRNVGSTSPLRPTTRARSSSEMIRVRSRNPSRISSHIGRSRGGRDRVFSGSWRVRQVQQLAAGLVPEADQRALVVERGDGRPEVARRDPGPGRQVGGRRGTERTQVAPDDVLPCLLDLHAAAVEEARVVEPGARRRDQRPPGEGPANLFGDMDERQLAPDPPPDRRLERPCAGLAGKEVTQLEASARRDRELAAAAASSSTRSGRGVPRRSAPDARNIGRSAGSSAR